MSIPPHRPLIQTCANGRRRDLLALKLEDCKVRPTAECLAKINRYAGETKWPFSVGTHSVLVARLLPEPFQYEGLMHDFVSEPFGLGDLISPLKRRCPEYVAFERAVRAQVAPWYGLRLEDVSEIHHADERAYQLECLYLRGALPCESETWLRPERPTDAELSIASTLLEREITWRESAARFMCEFILLAPEDVKARVM